MSPDAKTMPAPVEEYQKLIEQDFPNFKIESIKYLGSGWDNAAMLVNEQYVFRFPRGLFDQTEVVRTDEIEKEVSVLKYLSGKVSFATPEPAYVAPGFRYFGYNLLQGTLWDQVEQGQQFSDELLRSWVKTRHELSQTITPDLAGQLNIKKYHTGKNEELVKQYLATENVDQRVKDMAQEAMDYVLAHKNEQDWQFIHEDLQLSNAFVDPETKKITGVIDFFEAEIGPVEADFYFWSKYGADMLQKMADLEQEINGKTIDINLARAIHQFYIVADYQDFTNRGFPDSAARKWHQIEAYLK